MNQFTAQQKIELLERKYLFLMNSSPDTFIYDLRNFLLFLEEDEIVKDYTQVIYKKFRDDQTLYERILEEEKTKLEEYANDATDIGREISSFILNLKIDKIISPANILDRLKDWLDIPTLLIPQKEDKISTTMWEDYMEDILKDCNYYLTEWRSIYSTSAGRAWEDLRIFLNSANLRFKSLEGKTEGQKQNDLFYQIRQGQINKSNTKAVSKAIKSGTTYIGFERMFLSNTKKAEINEKTELTNKLKYKVTRVYETIRQEIGSTRLRITVLKRYAVRCENYNRTYIRDLAGKALSGKLEETLTSDLALYLFDNGITVWYRVKTEKKETDLIEIEPEASNPMLIEVKAFGKTKSNKSKNQVIKDFWQTISYLESHRKNNPSYEGYLVFYRLGGNLFTLPEKFSYQNVTIYPILIDLAENVGSKQNTVIDISIDEIMTKKPSKI